MRHKRWISLGLLLLWQGATWWSLQTLAMPWSVWVALAAGIVFGGAILMLWSLHYRRLKRAADYRVLEAHQQLETVRQEANKDPLTGLNSRRYMRERLEEALHVAIERNHLCAVLMMDLDFFKDINEALGHQLANQLLESVAVRLRSVVKKGDLLGYYGADEFIVLLPQIQDGMAAELVARRILASMSEPFAVNSHSLAVSASIGVSLGPTDGRDGETLIREADSALAQSKASGRRGYQFFTQSMNIQAAERLQIDQHLRGALERGELALVYQPIVATEDRSLKGMEALIRWNNPALGRVSPTVFIPIAEQIGVIGEIGHWVLKEACAQLRHWQTQYEIPMMMSINVSPRQFQDGSILAAVKTVLGQMLLNPNSLQLEVTEGLLVNASERVVRELNVLRDAGVQLALDDFGTGYSSLSYLRNLPFTVLKIDKTFINEIARRSQDEAMVDAMVKMGHSLGMSVVAEGVETAAQMHCLETLGVDSIQGYYFSQPLSPREFENRFLSRGRATGIALDASVWDRL
ncbi:putative bifunctional diguanylate cyclase/phosphodiesterase [Saccharospirillum alexandrii]|uniref:putative bifunctional diguanylate cyclase/phosphodiesterase n=1 Tax=Saccharospirillum alexandrii TaxID=2448477 RepID=UPI003734DC61